MNFNAKRLSNPLKSKCKHTTEIIETISALSNNRPAMRLCNKDFSIKVLGNAVETALTNCDCNKKEELTYARQIESYIMKNGGTFIVPQAIQDNGGFCIAVDNNNHIITIHYMPTLDGEVKRIDITAETSVSGAREVFNAFTYPLTNKAVKMLQDSGIPGSMDLNGGQEIIRYTHGFVHLISYIFTQTD